MSNQLFFKKFPKVLAIFCLFTFKISAQNKVITIDDIFVKGTFAARSVAQLQWMTNSDFYTKEDRGNILKMNVQTGAVSDTLFKANLLKGGFYSYELVQNESQILLASDFEPRYRHSGKANYHIYNLASKTISSLNIGKVSNLALSPAKDKIAYCKDNNLYINTIDGKNEIAITTDGTYNELIHGATDWVYEEEFGFTRAFDWSPDGKYIAYLSFNEKDVPMYHMQVWGDQYPGFDSFKYPKAGDNNAVVSLTIFDVNAQTKKPASLKPFDFYYIPNITWINPSALAVNTFNRKQNHMQLLKYQVIDGSTALIFEEKSDKYVDFEQNKNKKFFTEKEAFLYTSEKSGFKHLYSFDLKTNQSTQLTSGNWEVADVLGLDEKAKMIYFTAKKNSPLQKQLYSLQYEPQPNPKAKKQKKAMPFIPVLTQLSPGSGTYNIDLSPDCRYYVESYSAIDTPPVYQLKKITDREGGKVLEANERLNKNLVDYQVKAPEMMQVKAADGQTLNAWMIKPTNFDATKKYPVLMFVYGGPGNQQVNNQWLGRNYYWHAMLAQKGYIIFCADNRGTGGRGVNFRQSTYADLGRQEVQDQTAVAKYLGTLPYIDATRIGIWGWSYGGFMSSNCLFQSSDVFKAAIAVAPVTNWRFYDTIYTERFNGLPQENPKGYDENSPATHADKLKGKFLLIHGTGDDNVHFQNTITLQNALIAANKQFDTFIYPNRNHGIYGGNTSRHLYTMMTDWVLKNL